MTRLVSTIIPAYNYGHFLGRAIDSVLGQTYEGPSEVIVVDDGSKDDTRERMKAYEGRINYVYQDNRGLPGARNTGIRNAKGDILAFLDADDWWEPKKLERQLAYLDANPSIDACGVGEKWLTPEMVETAYIGAFPSFPTWQENMRGVALRTTWIGGACSGLVLRREVIDSIGPFDESLRAAEDWEFFLRLVAKHQIGDLDEYLNNRLVHNTGVFRNAKRFEVAQTAVFEQACTRWPEVFDAKLRRQVRAMILADVGGELALAGDLGGAAQSYAKSLTVWPFYPKRWRSVAILGAKEIMRRTGLRRA